MRGWALAALLAGCSGALPCPNDLPTSCPSPAPHYQADVAPALTAKCVHCHGPGGTEASKPLTSYSEVSPRKDQLLRQVFDCRMPPQGEVQLTPAQRAAVMAWVVCGASND